MEEKKWWQSKSILFGILTGIAAALAPVVPKLGEFVAANMNYLGMAWGVAAVVLRIVTKDKIKLLD